MTNKSDLDSIILSLIEKNKITTLHDIAIAAKLQPDSSAARRAIQRALKTLLDAKKIQAQGQARARCYVSVSDAIAGRSHILLDYLAQPVQSTKFVHYNPGFLKSYQPNHTFYLSAAVRADLLKLGQVESAVRPAGTYARTILNRLLIDLSWNSSRLEGNTYSLLETQRLIELGEMAANKSATEAQMILNHKNAIEYLIDFADEAKITSHEVRSIHALLSENLLGNSSASGRLREISVGISGAAYSPLENPHKLKECFDIFIEKINEIQDPFEQSFFSLVHLSYLQAFEDVNKRTSRLVANIPLIRKNFKPLSFISVNQRDYVTALLGVYEKNDVSLLCDQYHWAYQQSSQQYSAIQQKMGEPNLFKLKYRNVIHDITRKIILDAISGSKIVSTVKELIKVLKLSESEAAELFQSIETEIIY